MMSHHCFRDFVINFFIGRTREVAGVGFDVAFKRTGHVAFFIDALSKLRVAWCPEFYVLNDPGHCDPTHWNKTLRTGTCNQFDKGRHPATVWTKRDAINTFSRSFHACRGHLEVKQVDDVIRKRGYVNHTMYLKEELTRYNIAVQHILNNPQNEEVSDTKQKTDLTQSDTLEKHLAV